MSDMQMSCKWNGWIIVSSLKVAFECVSQPHAFFPKFEAASIKFTVCKFNKWN